MPEDPDQNEKVDSVEAAPATGTKAESTETPSTIAHKLIGLVLPEQTVTSEDRATLIAALGELSLDPTRQLEEQPNLIQAARTVLESLGYKPVDIHDKSLVIASKVDEGAAAINKLVRTSAMPTANYPSNVGTYGFKAEMVNEKLVYSRGLGDKVVIAAENLLRKSGDLGGNVLTALPRRAVRTKTTIPAIESHIKALGLEGYFQVNGETVSEKT